MGVHPALQSLLDQASAQNAPPLPQLGVDLARQGYIAARAFLSEKPEVAMVEDRAVPGPAGDIPIRIYTPQGEAPCPVLVYYHGGGWVIGSIETHDGICRAFANAAGCIVVSVDYRLAPEHRFPGGLDDAFAALQWVAKNAGEFGGDGSRLAIGGESAGANLVAVLAQLGKDGGGPDLAYQMMAYPVTHRDFDTNSYKDNGEGYFLTRDTMRWFWDNYLNDDAEASDPRTSPLLREDLSGLPPGIVVAPEYDPLRDEGVAYGKRLQEAGVDMEVWVPEGMIHDYLGMTNILPEAKEAIAQIGGRLKKAFAG